VVEVQRLAGSGVAIGWRTTMGAGLAHFFATAGRAAAATRCGAWTPIENVDEEKQERQFQCPRCKATGQ